VRTAAYGESGASGAAAASGAGASDGGGPTAELSGSGAGSATCTSDAKVADRNGRDFGWGDRSRGRYATPADFPRRGGTPHQGLHVRRWGLGLFIVQGPFSVAPCQTLESRFATFSSLYTWASRGESAREEGVRMTHSTAAGQIGVSPLSVGRRGVCHSQSETRRC
jgi:hypothetical protein